MLERSEHVKKDTDGAYYMEVMMDTSLHYPSRRFEEQP